jgi:fructose/tagatose bisphosphate aldolase
VKAIIFHSLAHARAALAAARDADAPVILLTPPQGARYAGPLFYWEVLRLAERDTGRAPDAAIIDCGDYAGVAMAAIRCGWRRLAFSGRKAVRARIKSMVEQAGGGLVDSLPDALDLLDLRDPDGACRRHLADN